MPDGEFRRLGENRSQRLDLRVVVAASDRSRDADGAAASAGTCCTASASSGWRRRRYASAGRTSVGLTVHSRKDIAAGADSRATPARRSPRACRVYVTRQRPGCHNVLVDPVVQHGTHRAGLDPR